MTCEGFLHQPGGCSPVKLLGFTCFVRSIRYLCFKNFWKTEFLPFWNWVFWKFKVFGQKMSEIVFFEQFLVKICINSMFWNWVFWDKLSFLIFLGSEFLKTRAQFFGFVPKKACIVVKFKSWAIFTNFRCKKGKGDMIWEKTAVSSHLGTSPTHGNWRKAA